MRFQDNYRSNCTRRHGNKMVIEPPHWTNSSHERKWGMWRNWNTLKVYTFDRYNTCFMRPRTLWVWIYIAVKPDIFATYSFTTMWLACNGLVFVISPPRITTSRSVMPENCDRATGRNRNRTRSMFDIPNLRCMVILLLSRKSILRYIKTSLKIG